MKILRRVMLGLAAVFIFATALLAVSKPASASTAVGVITQPDIKNATFTVTATGGASFGTCSSGMIIEGNFGGHKVDFNSNCLGGTWTFISPQLNPNLGGDLPTCDITNPNSQPPSDEQNTVFVQASATKSGLSIATNGPFGGTVSSINYGTSNPSCNYQLLKAQPIAAYNGGTTPSGTGSAFTDQTIGYNVSKNTTSKLTGKNFSFADGGNITLQFNGQTITFTDQQPEDGTFNFVTNNQPFCSSSGGGEDGQINLLPGDKTSNDFAALSKANIPFELKFSFFDTSASGGGQCKSADIKSYQIDSTNATEILQGVQGGVATISPNKAITMQQINNTLGYAKDPTDTCAGGDLFVLDSQGASTGTLYQGSGSVKASGYSCTFGTKRDVSVKGTAGQGPSPGPTPASGDNSDCVGQNSASGLEWLLCPITTSLEKAADKLDGQIEAQLHFDTKDSLPDNGPVHLTWAIIKNISSGLIVVLLLIMVIAQAMGGGPFEAYTIRKMLPKLVAAVILMQISWPLCIWLIGLANDFGKGIGQLMTIPFGGGGSLELNNILANAHWSTVANTALPVALLVTGIAAAVDLPATIVVVFGLLVGLVAAFMVLLFRNVMIMALVIFSPLAFLASTMSGADKLWKQWKDNFMKLLAMFPLIIAMVYVGRVFAWILAQQTKNPGLLNFMGVMVAYFGPYFMIFKAYKWGGSMMAAAGEGINKGVNKMAERPKKLLQSRAEQHKEGKAIAAADRLSRWQSLNRRQRLGSMVRGDKFRSGEWDPTMMSSSILRRERRVKKAKFIAAGPKYSGEEIEAETSSLQARLGNYDRADHDAIRQAIIMGTTATVHLADGRVVEFNGARPFGATRTPAQLQAALDRGVVHGHWKAIEGYMQQAMASGDQAQMAAATAFLDRNAQTIGAEMPHLLKGLNLAATSKPEAISRMGQAEIESILANLHARITTGVDERGDALTPAQIDTARENLSIFLRNYAAAATDSRLKTQMDSGGAKVVKAYASSNAAVLGPLNTNASDGRASVYGLREVPDHATAGAAIPAHLQVATNTAVADITAHITDEGIIH